MFLISNSVSSVPVKGDQIEQSLNNFAADYLESDILFKLNLITNPRSISEFSMRYLKTILPNVKNSYWLENSSTKYGYRCQAFVDGNGNSATTSYYISGLTNDKSVFSGSEMRLDGYDLSSDIQTSDFVQPANSYLYNYDIGVSLSEENKFQETLIDYYVKQGSIVYNNPIIMDDEHSDTLSVGNLHWIKGIVRFHDGVPLVEPCYLGETICLEVVLMVLQVFLSLHTEDYQMMSM